jgi:arabinoxylan arabinofuranohydrolase
LKSFAGTKPGNKTALNLFITPRTKSAFKINLWLDGPWANNIWKGKKIGEINVPANSSQETIKFTADVSSFVDGLDKKHAIFLVVEGAEPGGLCDLIGLGFSSDKKKIVRPVAPAVSIKVNGEAIDLPSTPVRSTNANGIVGLDLYETTYKLPSDMKGIPVVSASANNRQVKVSVTQAESKTGTAVVRFQYNGVVKTFRILFASE